MFNKKCALCGEIHDKKMSLKEFEELLDKILPLAYIDNYSKFKKGCIDLAKKNSIICQTKLDEYINLQIELYGLQLEDNIEKFKKLLCLADCIIEEQKQNKLF